MSMPPFVCELCVIYALNEVINIIVVRACERFDAILTHLLQYMHIVIV